MAVPKKKKSRSRSRMRKGSNGCYEFKVPNIVVDKETGEYRIAHHMGSNGVYRGNKIVADKKTTENKEETAA